MKTQTDRKSFFLLQLVGALLLLSLFAPYTSSVWEKIDRTFFHLLNQPLGTSSSLRTFWALANHRLADWIEDLCILGFYCAAIWKAPRGERRRRTAEMIFCVLLTALTILLVNRLLCRDLLRLRRQSPTLVLDNAVYLPDFLSWITVKTDSSKSFPGDHATTALMFACSYAFFVRGRLAFLALLYGVFLCLPRLAVGAHWFSDIFVGSASIVLFSLSCALFTPIGERVIGFIQKKLYRLKPTS